MKTRVLLKTITSRRWLPVSAHAHITDGTVFFQFSVTTDLRSDDGDGSENVAEEVNSRSFNLHRDYSKSLTLSNVFEAS